MHISRYRKKTTHTFDFLRLFDFISFAAQITCVQLKFFKSELKSLGVGKFAKCNSTLLVCTKFGQKEQFSNMFWLI